MTEAQWSTCEDPIAMLEFLRGCPTSEDAVTWGNTRWQLEGPCEGPDRKFRLFGCACCRRIWDLIPEPCNRDAVVAVEDYLDGRISGGAVWEALVASSAVEYKEDGSGRRTEPGYWVVKYLGRGFYKMTAAASALRVASSVLFLGEDEYRREASFLFDGCYYGAAGVFLGPFEWPLPIPAAVQAERVTQASILRCIFGNPYRPAALLDSSPLAFNNGMAGKLARAAYEERSMPDGTLDPSRLSVLADALEEAGSDNEEIITHLRLPGPHVRGCFALDLILGPS